MGQQLHEKREQAAHSRQERARHKEHGKHKEQARLTTARLQPDLLGGGNLSVRGCNPMYEQVRLTKAKRGKEEALATRRRMGEARARDLASARAHARVERANDYLVDEAKQRVLHAKFSSAHQIYMRRYVQVEHHPVASADAEGLRRPPSTAKVNWLCSQQPVRPPTAPKA